MEVHSTVTLSDVFGSSKLLCDSWPNGYPWPFLPLAMRTISGLVVGLVPFSQGGGGRVPRRPGQLAVPDQLHPLHARDRVSAPRLQCGTGTSLTRASAIRFGLSVLFTRGRSCTKPPAAGKNYDTLVAHASIKYPVSQVPRDEELSWPNVSWNPMILSDCS